MNNQGHYIAGCNIFALDLLKSATPGVPLTRRSVQMLADFMWPQGSLEKPKFVTKLLEVLAPAKDKVPDTPEGLCMLSPEGYAHALLLACARDLPKNKDHWAIVLKSVPFCFRTVPNAEKDMWISSWNCRNELSQEYESLSRTAWQLAHEIVSMKSRLESDTGRSLSNAEYVKELKAKGLKKATNQDEITVNLVDSALKIVDRMRGELMLEPLRLLEEKYGTTSCLNKMAALFALVTKPSSNSRAFVMQSLLHYILQGFLGNDAVTKSSLLGDKHSPGHIALWETKHLCLGTFLSYYLAKSKIDDKDILIIKEVLSDHKTYVARMLGKEVAWQGNLKRSSLEALQFLEAGNLLLIHLSICMLKTHCWIRRNKFKDNLTTPALQKLVYNKYYDNQLRAFARAHKNVDEILEQENIKEDWEKIVALRENELLEGQVKKKLEEDEEPEAETALATMRWPAQEFSENSFAYWAALANTSVRRYVSFVVMPTTQSQMQRLVAQSSIKDVVLQEGSAKLGRQHHLVNSCLC